MSSKADRQLADLPKADVEVDTTKLQQFTCEFCGKGFWVDVDRGHLIHEIPYCTEFDVYDPVQYMRENNRLKAGKVAKA